MNEYLKLPEYWAVVGGAALCSCYLLSNAMIFHNFKRGLKDGLYNEEFVNDCIKNDTPLGKIATGAGLRLALKTYKK